MKPAFTRRYRRRNTPSRSEGTFFKKESQQEQSFFGESSHDPFFQPTVAPAQIIQRKCDKCEEDKKMQRAEDKKEEDKKVMKKAEKKEEEKVMKKEDKKEKEKVMRTEDKKEEEKAQRQPEKKEEEKIHRAADKKEEEKVMKMEEKKEEDKVHKKEAGTSTSSGKGVSNYISSLNGKGNPLPPQSNHFFSSKMGYDFSDVKIHTDKEAAESAKAINAKAYTIGNNVVFNEGQYNTESGEGKKLMAHELAHVFQGSEEPHRKIRRKGDPFPKASQGDLQSCGAASIVAAIMIHDKEANSNSGFIGACNIVLSYYSKHHKAITDHLEKGGKTSNDDAEKFYGGMLTALLTARDNSNVPNAQISDTDANMLAGALYGLYIDPGGGLVPSAINSIREMLGVGTKNSTGGLNSYSEIISCPALQGLAPGQIAQVSWHVKLGAGARLGTIRTGRHVFLIGRLKDGTWYMFDQAKPTHFEAPTLGALDSTIQKQSATGGTWIFTGRLDYIPIGEFNGVTILADNSGITALSTNYLKSGDYLCSVDKDAFTFSNKINVDGFHGEYYKEADAKSAAKSIPGKGAAIIEMPTGRFLVYSTNMVSEANMNESKMDAGGGGNFTSPNFFNAWIQLRSNKGGGILFKAY